MHLTNQANYAFKILMHLAIHPDRLSTVQEIASAYGLSRSHLTKVVHRLALSGLIGTSRGRGGGIRLNAAPETIRLGVVARLTESDFTVVECFDDGSNQCRLSPVCVLKHALGAATVAYLQALDQLTVADLVGPGAMPEARRRIGETPGRQATPA